MALSGTTSVGSRLWLVTAYPDNPVAEFEAPKVIHETRQGCDIQCGMVAY